MRSRSCAAAILASCGTVLQPHGIPWASRYASASSFSPGCMSFSRQIKLPPCIGRSWCPLMTGGQDQAENTVTSAVRQGNLTYLLILLPSEVAHTLWLEARVGAVQRVGGGNKVSMGVDPACLPVKRYASLRGWHDMHACGTHMAQVQVCFETSGCGKCAARQQTRPAPDAGIHWLRHSPPMCLILVPGLWRRVSRSKCSQTR